MNKNVVISNLFWKFLERCGSQGVSLIVSIVLARLLDPSVHGTISLVIVFTTILEVFIDSGLGNALIQKKNTDDLDFSSVFYFNIILASILYLIIYVLAPKIADYFHNYELIRVIRTISITLLISSVRNVQNAYVAKNLLFNIYFRVTLIATIFGAVVGIMMAYNNFGVWALVAQHLTIVTVGTIELCFFINWKPRLMFSFQRLNTLLSFGWKLLVTNLIERLYNNLRVLIIGRFYSPQDLAYYNSGQQYPFAIVNNINTTLDHVLFPVASQLQDNREQVKCLTRRAIRTGTFLIAPLMMGLAAVSDAVVSLLMTEKWLPCSFYIKLFCFSFMFYPIITANINAIKALGRTDIILKLEVLKKILGISIIGLTMMHGVKAIAIGLSVCSILDVVIYTIPNNHLFGYRLQDLIRDIFPGILASLSMAIFIYYFQFFQLSIILTLLLQIFIGFIFYICISWLFKIESFIYIINIIKQMMITRSKVR